MSQQFITLEDLKIHERLVVQETLSQQVLTELKNLNHKVDKVEERLTTRISAVEQRVGHIEERVAHVEGMVKNLPTSLHMTTAMIATAVSVGGFIFAALKFLPITH